MAADGYLLTPVMNHQEAHQDLRKLRYWAARHKWESDHDSNVHDITQIKNIKAALEAWQLNLFNKHARDLLFLLLDVKDSANGKWVQRPLLISDTNIHLHEHIAKYFYLVQAFPKTIPSVQKFFFHRLNWDHEILSFRHGAEFASAKEVNSSIKTIIGDNSFLETWITLPEIQNSDFYDTFLNNYEVYTHIPGTMSKSPNNAIVGDGTLELGSDICHRIWGVHSPKCYEFVKLALFQEKNIAPSHDDIFQGMWVLANISWGLTALAKEGIKYHYHYYFYRALSPDNKDDDFFHTSGHGLLSWASTVDQDLNEAAIIRQTVALTACVTFSRISDSALPLYERRAVTQFAQSRLGQKATLMWVLDKLLLPVMLGAELQRNHENGEFGFLDSGVWKNLKPVSALKKFVDTLWPNESWRPRCRKEEQLKYLRELIEPLKAEQVPQDAIESLEAVSHDIKKIGKRDRQSQERDKRNLAAAQTRVAAAGALFVPAQKALQKVKAAFDNWNATKPGTSDDETRKQLDTAVKAFGVEFGQLGQLCSLDTLMQEWEGDGVELQRPCGKALVLEGFPDNQVLPFYISDLDLAYRALRDNWIRECEEGKTKPKALFRCCALPNQTFLVCWREEPGWCSNFAQWSQEVWKSLSKDHGSSRGLPFVLRFAAQNSAAHLWVRTADGSRNCILGEDTKLDAILATSCGNCLNTTAPKPSYEVGFLFKMNPESSAVIVQ